VRNVQQVDDTFNTVQMVVAVTTTCSRL